MISSIGGVAKVSSADDLELDTQTNGAPSHLRRDSTVALPPVHSAFDDGRVRVMVSSSVSAGAAKALADRIEQAYAYDEAKQHWDDTAKLSKRLTVAVLSPSAFANLTGDTSGSVAGVTISPDVFVVPTRVLGGANAEDDDTIAHELGHVQDLRQAGARISRVPIYLQEGKEYLLGDGYPKNNAHIGYVAERLADVDAETADSVMRHFRTVQDEAESGSFGFYGETVGALYVEWLRTRLGVKDAMHQVALTIEDVGRGATYDAAFRKHFGVDAEQTEKQFVQYIADTEGDPSARLKGTLYEV